MSILFDGSDAIERAINPCISNKKNEEIIREPSPKEIKEVTFAIHAHKAPDSNGFSARFFQSNWETIEPAIFKEIQLFFVNK